MMLSPDMLRPLHDVKEEEEELGEWLMAPLLESSQMALPRVYVLGGDKGRRQESGTRGRGEKGTAIPAALAETREGEQANQSGKKTKGTNAMRRLLRAHILAGEWGEAFDGAGKIVEMQGALGQPRSTAPYIPLLLAIKKHRRREEARAIEELALAQGVKFGEEARRLLRKVKTQKAEN